LVLTREKTTIRFASRVQRIQPSPTLLVMTRAKELAERGIDVIDFGPGEPDFATPAAICQAAKDAIDAGCTKYTNSSGTNELRDAIAANYNSRYDTSLGRANVITGTGGKQELFNLMMALVDDGDEVIIPIPYWVSFPDQVLLAGGTPVFVHSDDSTGFRPTMEGIDAAVTERTRGVILNSPSNPSGAVIDEAELEKIIALCHDRGLFLIFDETYEFFVYDNQGHVSAARYFDRYPETVIIVNSMSKTYAMTGWRIGYAIAHPKTINAMANIQSHSTSNPSSISQAAAVAALNGTGDEVRRMYEAYVERRRWLVPALDAIPGIRCSNPGGAFYVFPRVSELYGHKGINNSIDFSTYLLDEANVAVVPGSAFGADDYVRISYATSIEALRTGVERIDAAARKLLS
jgi:aspartate aminotransferase